MAQPFAKLATPSSPFDSLTRQEIERIVHRAMTAYNAADIVKLRAEFSSGAPGMSAGTSRGRMAP